MSGPDCCGCAQCRRAAAAPPAGWTGWSRPVSLARIAAMRAAARHGWPLPAAARPLFAVGPQLYRISRAGIDRDRPLSIGRTCADSSIAARIACLYRRPGPGDAPVHRAIRNLPSGRIFVQTAGRGLPRGRVERYRIWLQASERPLLAAL
ncbi:MAG TPA: hypothetical protein VGD66_08930 [Allosphingosinicella sp.]